MKRKIIIALKVVGCLVALLVAVVLAAGIVLNTSYGQQKLLGYATGLLEEKLQTKVTIDSVHVDFWTFNVDLLRLNVEDRQQRQLLQADRLEVGLDLKDLMAGRVEVRKAEAEGIRLWLDHPRDSASNYQFVLDAFKRKKADPQAADSVAKQSGGKLALDVSTLHVKDIELEYQGFTKKGFQQISRLQISELTMKGRGDRRKVTVEGLHVTTDNHQPRKNEGRPKRGAFDAGHLDITARLALNVNQEGQDAVGIVLDRFEATDSVTGFYVSDLHLQALVKKDTAYVSNFYLRHRDTELQLDSATVVLPSKKAGRKLSYSTSVITGRTLLHDIAQPFAPVLSRFSIPLQLQVRLSGTDSTMLFRDIHVNTEDQRLKIDASGNIAHLRDKERLAIRFHVDKMTTDAQTAKNVIDQFTVKKFMMKQLDNLGAIGYTGDVTILYKKELFNGQLRTSAGRVNVSLTLDDKAKYLTGHVRTASFKVGEVVQMKDIGPVTFGATFGFDYSKERTARVRRVKGGHLPIGQVEVQDAMTSYKGVKLKHIDATIKSDGAIAEGRLVNRHKHVDLLCNFTFTNTDSIQKMKIKPGLKIH